MIENTLLYFKTKTAFNTQLEADNIKNDSITFIQDTKQIWTHGTYFDCDNSAGNIKVSDELAASAGVTNKNVEAMLSALVVGYNWFYETALPSKQDNITDLDNIRSGASLGATAVQPSQLASVATSGSYDDLLNAPTLPSSTSPLPIDSGGTGSNNAEDACDNIGAVKKYDIFKTLSKEGWYRIGLLTAIMSTSSARIIVGGTNADVTPIIMDFQHNFRGNMLSQMPTVMTPLYVTKVRAVRYTSDDVYIDLYFTNVSSSHTTVRVIPYEGTFEPMNYVDVTNEAVTVLTSIDIIKDGFLADKLTKDEAETTYQPIGDYVTLDTEQTITGKKYINDTTFRFKNSENTIETVVTNRAISMQPMDGVEKPSSILNIQSMTGGKIHITNSNSKNQTVWPKQLSVTNLKYDTQDRCGVYVDTDENRQQVVVGYFKNVNGVFYTLSSLSTGKYAEIIADCLYLHSGASSNDELNAAAFKWDSASNMLHLNRKYYDGQIKDGNIYAVVNTTGGNGGFATMHHTNNSRGIFALQNTGLVINHLKNDASAETTGKDISVYNWLAGKITLNTYDGYNMQGWGGQISMQTLKMIGANTPGSCVSLIMKGYESNNVDESITLLGAMNYVNKNLTHIAEKVDGHKIGLGATKLLMHGPVETEADQNAACFEWDNTTNTLDIKRVYYNNGSVETGDVNLTVNDKQVATMANIVNHGTGDSSFALTPNTYHVWGTMSSLTLTLSTPADTTVYNEYMFEFTSGSTATTLSLPSTIKWANAPSIEANKTYQVNIVNNLGVIAGFAAI